MRRVKQTLFISFSQFGIGISLLWLELHHHPPHNENSGNARLTAGKENRGLETFQFTYRCLRQGIHHSTRVLFPFFICIKDEGSNAVGLLLSQTPTVASDLGPNVHKYLILFSFATIILTSIFSSQLRQSTAVVTIKWFLLRHQLTNEENQTPSNFTLQTSVRTTAWSVLRRKVVQNSDIFVLYLVILIEFLFCNF